MKIANILGLYLGCKVKLKSGHIFTLHGVYKNNGMFNLNKRSTFTEPLKDCKLLLTPLSKISKEDKRAFEKVFRVRNLQEVSNIRCNGVYVLLTVNFDMGRDRSEVDATPCELLWLASKGYDIGICPKEYKEITE